VLARQARQAFEAWLDERRDALADRPAGAADA
jgi:hypothetical protein